MTVPAKVYLQINKNLIKLYNFWFAKRLLQIEYHKMILWCQSAFIRFPSWCDKNVACRVTFLKNKRFCLNRFGRRKLFWNEMSIYGSKHMLKKMVYSRADWVQTHSSDWFKEITKNESMNSMQTCNSVMFYFMKNSFSDVSRKWILPNMIRVVSALIIFGTNPFLLTPE